MKERKTIICITNKMTRGGVNIKKKISVPDVTKIIVAVRTDELKQVQASMDINTENVLALRKKAKRK